MENQAKSLRVYRKASSIKGAYPYWYTAKRSDGASIVLKFKCTIPDMPVFEISNVIGTCKAGKPYLKDESEVQTFTYYVTACDVSEVAGFELPL